MFGGDEVLEGMDGLWQNLSCNLLQARLEILLPCEEEYGRLCDMMHVSRLVA